MSRIRVVFLVVSLLFVGLVGSVSAEGEAPVVGKKTVWNNIQDAGIIGYVTIALSIAGFALAITFAINYRRDSLVPPDLLAHLEELLENGDYEEAYNVCEANDSFFSRVIAAGLQKVQQGAQEMEKVMIDAGDQEATRMHQSVSYLSLIAAVAPMLGLLGTVVGMVRSFNVIAQSVVNPSPAELAGGISMALMTTVIGLCVAIPMTMLYFFFRNRVISGVNEVGNVTEEILERFRAGRPA